LTLDGRVRGLETLEASRFSGARVYNSGNISISDSAFTDLTFDSERQDTDDYHNPGSNPERLTVPVDGTYLVTGHLRFAASSTGVRIVRIVRGGTTVLAQQRITSLSFSVIEFSIATTHILPAGQYVTLSVWQNSGGNLNVESANNFSPEFSIALLG